MYWIWIILIFFDLCTSDVIDPLSNHNLGTANDALKNDSSTNSTESLGPCTVCRYSAKSFANVSMI